MPLTRDLVWVRDAKGDLWHIIHRLGGKLRAHALCSAYDLVTGDVVPLNDPPDPAQRCAVCELFRTPNR